MHLKDVQEMCNIISTKIDFKPIISSLSVPFFLGVVGILNTYERLKGTSQRYRLIVHYHQPLRAPEKAKRKTQETDWENLEEKYPGITDIVRETGDEAKKIYSALKEAGFKKGATKLKEAALYCLRKDKEFFKLIKEEDLDKNLFMLTEHHRRDFIGSVLRVKVLKCCGIEKEKQKGQHLSARHLYKIYNEIKKRKEKSP